MAIYDSRLSRIVEILGRYYGVVSKEKFLSILAFGDNQAIENFGSADLDNTTELEKIMRVFTDLTEGGVTMSRAFETLFELVSSSNQETQDTLLQTAQQIYRFIGEVNSFSSNDKYEAICSDISISELCDIKPSVNGSDGTLNGKFDSPTKFTPNLCALEVYDPKLTPATRDTGAVGLFMNCMPTLELSRAVPYLDITLITPRDGIGVDGRIQSLSLSQFISGQSRPTSETDILLASAVDEEAIRGVLEKNESDNALARSLSKEESFDINVSTAGMELFLAPQTLVPTINGRIETYGDFETFSDIKDEDGRTYSVGGRRGAPIIDPFRPLMSIEDFSISVTPSKGMMSHKTATLSLTLHDRSRLTEIAEFVKPDLYGTSELIITYGWSHPDDSASVDASIRSGNYYGTFLNALKVTEKYMIVNSSFSFDEVGQVKISLSLSMKGSSDVDTTTIGQGEDVETAVQSLKDMIDMVKQLKSAAIDAAENLGNDEAKDVFGQTFFSAASSTSGALSIDAESLAAVKKFITQNKNSNGTTGDLAKALEDLFGDNGQVSQVQKTIAQAVATKIGHLKTIRRNNKDPFAKDLIGDGGSTTYVSAKASDPAFISYGALLLYMVGKPLAMTRRFDEVQFVFYPMNDKASYLKDFTTAQIPIKIEDFEKVFKENTKSEVNLPLSRFMGMVGKEFIHNQAAYAYGLTGLYTTDDKGNTSIKETYKENPGQLEDEKKKRLEDAYGPTADLMFKMPRIRFHIEAVPGKFTGHEAGRKATILRIHIYDAVCTSYTALEKLITASRSNSLGLLSSAASKSTRQIETARKSRDANISVSHSTEFYNQLSAAIERGLLESVPATSGALTSVESLKQTTYFRVRGGFHGLKNFIQSTMPTITYGTSNSAVTSADLSSMNDSKLASVNMLRAGLRGDTAAPGVRDSGVPLQVTPVTLSLTTIGCPIVNYGQSFFVDFGTGTTIDNIYAVTGIDHSISKGKFETKLKMTSIDAFGKYNSMIENVTKAINVIKSSE